MIENLHFERLNLFLKEARNNAKAFGGVQVIVTGDVSINVDIDAGCVLNYSVLSATSSQTISALHRLW